MDALLSPKKHYFEYLCVRVVFHTLPDFGFPLGMTVELSIVRGNFSDVSHTPSLSMAIAVGVERVLTISSVLFVLLSQSLLSSLFVLCPFSFVIPLDFVMFL